MLEVCRHIWIRNVASYDKASVKSAEITCSLWAGYSLGNFSKPESRDSAVCFQFKYANYKRRHVAYIKPKSQVMYAKC